MLFLHKKLYFTLLLKKTRRFLLHNEKEKHINFCIIIINCIRNNYFLYIKNNINEEKEVNNQISNISVNKDELQGLWVSEQTTIDGDTIVAEIYDNNFLLIYSGVMFINSNYTLIDNNTIIIDYKDNNIIINITALKKDNNNIILECNMQTNEAEAISLNFIKQEQINADINGTYTGFMINNMSSLEDIGASIELYLDKETKTGTIKNLFETYTIKYLISANTITFTTLENSFNDNEILLDCDVFTYEIKDNYLFLSGHNKDGLFETFQFIKID